GRPPAEARARGRARRAPCRADGNARRAGRTRRVTLRGDVIVLAHERTAMKGRPAQPGSSQPRPPQHCPPRCRPLSRAFFDRESCVVARELVGKVLRRRYRGLWLSAAIVEAEAYYLHEKGSHASLGRTPSREALFMPAGTIYMYHSRAGDSMNVSCAGEGNAVLLKAGVPVVDDVSGEDALACMRRLHPRPDGTLRSVE